MGLIAVWQEEDAEKPRAVPVVRERPPIESRFPTAVTSPSPTDEQRRKVVALRDAIIQAARTVEVYVPDGGEKELAVMHLQEALMWASKAVSA